MLFHGARLVFHGSRLVFMVFHGSRSVFHGSRPVFHGSRLVFMVFHGSRLVFMVFLQNVSARTVSWSDDPVKVRPPEGGKRPSFSKGDDCWDHQVYVYLGSDRVISNILF